MRILACNSPYGQGGIGQHFAQLVEESRDAGRLGAYFCYRPHPDDSTAVGRSLLPSAVDRALFQYTPLRWSPAWKSHVMNHRFDRQTAAALAAPDLPSMTRFMGFAGKSLHAFQAARRRGAAHLELIVPNSHVDNLAALHARAAADTGIADTWLNDAQRAKTKREYAAADRIYVHSEYVRTSFLQAGIPAEKLRRTVLHVDPRFQPPDARPDDGVFRVVYVGRIDATKGIPLLLDAFDRLPIARKELILVGGWGTRRMRRFMAPWIDRPDVRHAPGDPLPALHRADAFVHPSYEDGFGYAPMEALACGVPVVVTKDTGMKESVNEGRTGFIVPTGDADALLDRLLHLHRHPLAATHSLLPTTLASWDH